MFDFTDQNIEEGMDSANNANESSEMNDINEAIFNYRSKDINLLNSPAPVEEGDTSGADQGMSDLIEFAVEDDYKHVSDMSSGRLTENRKNKNEISKKDVKDVKEEKEDDDDQPENLPFFTNAMTWISLSVTLIFYFIVGMYIYTRNIKWVYILISEILLETFARLIKIISMRYDYQFLMRPGKCIRNKYEKNFTLYKNFLLKGLVKEEDKEKYSMRGFPSNHVTKCAAFITLTYLFFPKYRKILRVVGPIYVLLTIFSRMYLNCHTLIQSIGGVITGLGGSYILYNLFK